MDITEKLDDRLKRQDEAVANRNMKMLSKSDIKWAQQRIKQLDMYIKDLKDGIKDGDRSKVSTGIGGIESTMDILRKNLKPDTLEFWKKWNKKSGIK